jgi:hypothetical protein
MMFSNKRPIVAQPAGRVPGMVNPMVINGTINGDLSTMNGDLSKINGDLMI